MARWELRIVGLLFLLVSGLPLTAQPEIPVTVTVTLDGRPAEALIKIFQNEQLRSVEYTDVHTPGRAQFQLPPGDYTLSVERGAGFTALPKTLPLAVSSSAVVLAARLERALDPRSQGYYSADLHAHSLAGNAAMERFFRLRNEAATPTDQLVGVQMAADLDIVFLSDHNSVDGHELFARTARERAVPFLLSEEITTLVAGHFNPYPLNPAELVEFDFNKTPSQFFAEARAKGAVILQVNHPYDPLFGYFLERNRALFDPSFDAVEVFNGPFDETDLRTIQRMFEFWNEGKRYTAVGVSDDHDWKDLLTQYGTPRTYVLAGEELSVERFIAALKAGRAFATYGPLVFFTALGFAVPGDTVQLRAGEKLSLRAEIQSVTPLDGLKAEIVHNREPLGSFVLHGLSQTISTEDTPTRAGWYAVRLLDAQQRYLALTNPIWVELGS